MKVTYTSLETCAQAQGAVVVIDVLRAFTTAAYAFAAGAREILLVSAVEEVLQLRQRFPDVLLAGEVDGLPIPGFDLSNSPSALAGKDLRGRRLVQRTSAGTQGVVNSQHAGLLLASSFVCASATVEYLRQRAPRDVSFVITGILGPRDGDEDRACAEYMAALLRGETPDLPALLQRVRDSYSARLFSDPDMPEFPEADLHCALQVDRFNFALPVQRQEGLLVMRPAVR